MNLVFLLQWNKNSLFQCHKAFLTRSVINEVRTHLPFTQVRSYRRKRQSRNFHVTTVTNSIGKAVVEYFSCRTDVQHVASGSFVAMENDKSRLAGERKKTAWFELENGVLEKIKTDCLASQFLIIPIITGFFPMAQKFAAMTSAMPCSGGFCSLI